MFNRIKNKLRNIDSLDIIAIIFCLIMLGCILALASMYIDLANAKLDINIFNPIQWLFVDKLGLATNNGGSGYTGGRHPIIAGGNIIMMP